MGINFLDDYTHVSLFTVGKLWYLLEDCGFEIERAGIVRNVGYALAAPVLFPLGLLFGRRPWVVYSLQNLIGLSIYACVKKPLLKREKAGWVSERAIE